MNYRMLGAIPGLGFVFIGFFVLLGGLDVRNLRWVSGTLSLIVGAYFIYWGLNKSSFRK